jgi:drug/metabolite transporter (DMT)-like permease
MQIAAKQKVLFSAICVFLLGSVLLSSAKASKFPTRFNVQRVNYIANYSSQDELCKEQQSDVASSKPGFIGRKFARGALIGSSFVYSCGYICTKSLQEILNPEIINVLRFFIASLCFLPVIIINGSKGLPYVWAGVQLGLLCAVAFATQSFAISYSTVSKAALFSSLAVIVPPLLEIFSPTHSAVARNDSSVLVIKTPFFGRLLQSRLFPAFLAFLGAAFIEYGGAEVPHFADLFLLLTPLSFGIEFWRNEYFAKKFPSSVNVVSGYTMLFCTLFLTLWGGFRRALPVTIIEWKEVFVKLISRPLMLSMLLFLGILSTAVTALVEQRSLNCLSASETGIIYGSEPVFASLLSCFLLKEPVTWKAVTGAVLIICSCLLL